MEYEHDGQYRGREQYDANRYQGGERYQSGGDQYQSGGDRLQSGDRYPRSDYYDRGQSYDRNDHGHHYQPYYPGYHNDRGFTGTPDEPVIDKFGAAKVADYLRQALETNDTDGNGYLSRREFDESQKGAKTPLDEQAAEFVSKHFGALSILSTDGFFSEGGISQEDIANFHTTNPINEARNSYSDNYEDIGGKIGSAAGAFGGMLAQAADFVFLGGTLTGVSVLGHMGLAGYLAFEEGGMGPAGAMAPAAFLAAGMMWGPMYGGLGGYAGGKYAGEQLSTSYFARKHEPQIQAMLSDLNPPQT